MKIENSRTTNGSQWRRRFQNSFALLVIVLGALAIAASPAAAPKPNVLLIVADDLGYGEPGCFGGKEIPTPHIDALAAEGVRFTSGYVTASYCAPSRAGMITGRHQARFGNESNPVGEANLDPARGLSLSETTMADRLKAAGYATGLAGKWHLGGTPGRHPQRRGFDEFFGFLHEGHFYVPGPPWAGVNSFLRKQKLPVPGAARFADGAVIWSNHTGRDEPPYDAGNPLMRGTQVIETAEYLTGAFTREAVDFIERHRGAPFFLCLAYNAVHSPMQAAPAHLGRFAHIEDIHRRVFAAMLAQLDDGIGAVMAKLRERGLDERTLVIFLSDNGGPTKELTSSNAPLRGGKGSLYEGGVRVPFIMRWPGALPAGRIEDRPVTALDILPTALAAAGSPAPAGANLDGVNLLPFLNGKNPAAPHETFYWRMTPKAALRFGDWKIVRPAKDAAWELYDLAADFAEQHDLALSRPEMLRDLTAKWETLNAKMPEPAD